MASLAQARKLHHLRRREILKERHEEVKSLKEKCEGELAQLRTQREELKLQLDWVDAEMDFIKLREANSSNVSEESGLSPQMAWLEKMVFKYCPNSFSSEEGREFKRVFVEELRTLRDTRAGVDEKRKRTESGSIPVQSEDKKPIPFEVAQTMNDSELSDVEVDV